MRNNSDDGQFRRSSDEPEPACNSNDRQFFVTLFQFKCAGARTWNVEKCTLREWRIYPKLTPIILVYNAREWFLVYPTRDFESWISCFSTSLFSNREYMPGRLRSFPLWRPRTCLSPSCFRFVSRFELVRSWLAFAKCIPGRLRSVSL